MLTPLGNGWEPLVTRLTEGLGLPLDGTSLAAVSGWLDLTVIWNARLDLTAARDAETLVDLALADAAVLVTHTGASREGGAAWVDVGPGAGAPGLALALLRRDLTLTLVEPIQKRVSFLRTAIGATGAMGVRVERARGEQLAGQDRRFDVAVSRAVLAPDAWLSLGMRLVHDSGAIWLLLAREAPPDVAGWKKTVDCSYRWPLTGAARRAVRYERESQGSSAGLLGGVG